MTDTPHPLIGRIITAVYLSGDREAIRFDFAGGDHLIARTDADCCSRTWIESVQGLDQILHSQIVAVENVDGLSPTVNNHPEHDCLQFYGCKITSGMGYALIDYRNASNGYYGGSLEWPGDGYRNVPQDLRAHDNWVMLDDGSAPVPDDDLEF